MSKVLRILLSALSAVCMRVTADDAKALPHPTMLSVAAISEDVHSVVLRDEYGRLRRYMVGEAVADTSWHVVHVAVDTATFELSHRINNRSADMRLALGDAADFGAEEAKLTAPQPVGELPITASMRPLKHKPER
jgi:hypothetical protein